MLYFIFQNPILEQLNFVFNSNTHNMYCMQNSLSLLHEQIKCMEILDIISSHILSSHWLLSHFSHVQFSATPWTLAHQDPLSMGFSRQEYWSGLPFPSLTLFLILLSEVKQKLTKSCPILCDPLDYIVHGILQARILEWTAFPFSREFSQPRDRTQIICIAGRFFTS